MPLMRPPPYDDPRPWLKAKLRRTFLVLLWEEAWRALWPLASLAGLFLALALLDVLPELPGGAHAAVLAGFALAGAVALAWAGRDARLPRRDDLLRRLERDPMAGGHRPLSALDDRLATGDADPAAIALWQAHLGRMRAIARRLVPGVPSPGVPARDPHGLRAVPVLLLVVAATVGWREAPERLVRALSPAAMGSPAAAVAVKIWLTPPEYTGQRPLLLDSARPAGPVTVPVGTAVLAMVENLPSQRAPELRTAGSASPFAPLGGGSHRAETALTGSGDVAVANRGRVLAHWFVTVVPDQPPRVAFQRPPAEAGRWRLRLDYDAADDYGLTGLSALIERGGKPFELALPLADQAPRTARGGAVNDLTAHPWAGLQVGIRLFARDSAGHSAVTDAVTVTLPERIFEHPVARAIAAERKRMIAEPENFAAILRALDGLAARPETFNNDIVVYLALRFARQRVTFDRADAAVDAARELLWRAALRLEDGELAVAEGEMGEAEKALADALARDADAGELEALIDRYREALDRYLSALAQRLGETPLPMPPGQALDGAQMTAMLERMRELAGMGARDAVRRMLSDMTQLMQTLRGARMPDQQAMREAREVADAMKALAERQQELMEKSFQMGQETRRTVNRDRMTDLATQQEAVRRDLGTMMERLAEGETGPPEALGRAELAMREAAKRLGEGDPATAAEAQGRALHELRQGSQAAMRQMMRQMMGRNGPTLLPGGQSSGGVDPFGRYGGAADDGSVAVPTQPEARSARRILEELRRRAGERDRPKPELDYIDRLLREF